MAAILAALLSILMLLTACAGSSSSEGSSTATLPEEAADAAYEVVAITTEDGITLSGRLYGSGTRGVVLSHMYPADQTSWSHEAERLAEEGYLVLTFDFRGYGLSQGDKDIQLIDRDVTAAALYLRGAGAQEMVLVGASMGGTASLVAASELQYVSSFRVAGVATFSAPVAFQGLSAREAAAVIQIAMLFVAAEDDVGADGARELQDLSGDNGDLQVLPGGDHGTDLFTGSQADTAWQLLLDFVRLCMPIGG